jgi:hypothetical protein
MKKLKISKEQYNRITNLLKEEFSGVDNSSKENTGDLKQQTLDFIKYLYNKTEDSPTYDDICKTLETKGFIVKKDGKFKLSKSLGSAEEAKQAVENELSKMFGGEKEEIEEGGEWFDNLSDNPANRPDPKGNKSNINLGNIEFEGLSFNGEMAILKDKQNMLYVLNSTKISESEMNEIARELGMSEEWKYDDSNILDILSVYGDIIKNEVGEGLEDWENGVELVKINDELKNEILDLYSNDSKITSNLSTGLNEEESEDDRMTRLKSVITQKRAESEKLDAERVARVDKQNSLKPFRPNLTKEPNPEPEIKKPIGQHNIFGGVDEMDASASGSFTTALDMKPMKKQIPIIINVPVVKEGFDLGKGYTHFAIFKSDGKIANGWDYSSLYDKYEKAYDDDSIKEYAREDIMNDFPENKVSDFRLVSRKFLEKKGINPSDTNNWYKSDINEMLDVASAGNFQYDTPGGLTMDLGKKNPKTKAEKTPQWSGGEFVEQPKCSKLDNNKEAQNGGCNTGASSLKTKKAKGSINAPSLGENKIYETIAKKTGKTINEVKRIIKSKNNK